MKVLYVVHSFPPFHWRGAEVYAMELATAMSRRGQAHVFYLRDDPEAEGVVLESDEFRGLPVHRARLEIDPTEPETYFFNREQEESFRELLNEIGPEVVHFIYYAGGLSLGLARVARESGAKVAITVTDFSGPCPRGQLLDRDGAPCQGPRDGLRCLRCLFDKSLIEGHSRIDRVLRGHLPPALASERGRPELALIKRRLRAVREVFAMAGMVVYPNDNTRERHHRAGINAKNEMVRDYGIDVSRFEGHRKSASETTRIGFIAQLLPHKGLHVLAEAIDSIPEAGTLICHGSHGDPGVEAYLNSFDEYRGRIEFRGNFAFEQMNEVLEGIDVLVAPSLWQENCPLTVKYAIATGTWAVLADQPGMVARREGLERVRFYEPNSVASLKRTLIEVLGETGEQKMGNGSVDFSLAKVIASGALIDVDQQAKELEQIYSKLMK